MVAHHGRQLVPAEPRIPGQQLDEPGVSMPRRITTRFRSQKPKKQIIGPEATLFHCGTSAPSRTLMSPAEAPVMTRGRMVGKKCVTTYGALSFGSTVESAGSRISSVERIIQSLWSLNVLSRY